MKRCQVTLEYVATMFLGVIFLMVMLFYLNQEYTDYRDQRTAREANDLISSLKIEIDTAYSVREGYSRVIDVPDRIAGADYTLNIARGELVLKARGREYVKIIPKVSGNFTLGKNYITNHDGIVRINT